MNGGDPHAAWDDFKFGIQHYADFERIAMIGDKRWEEWMARLCKPFTRAAVKYFDVAEADAAGAWVSEGV
ncbi:MAG: STAS/SEC14 domain-containing protein [Thiocapsa sp.]|nr:STAS/SEC14 domain-containing protein [Thiocapsa sp.]MCG6897872.1 STAS/SEC14 domain-containing protein [Thiocapsa sp.]